jgi:mannose-6-phosphate isomerase-like protein (cupin superfamily)
VREGSGWKSVRLDEIEPIPVVGGTLLWRPLRRTLDVGAFGINAYTAPNAGDDVVEEHTEKLYRHEEIYLVLSGRATFTLDGETLDAPAGTAVFLRDPSVKRHARAEEPDTAVLAIGGPRDEAYRPSAWEHAFAAERHRASGDYDAMAAEIAAGLEQHPDDPSLLYDLGCAEALAGRLEDALAHVGRALELKPEWQEHAGKDPDLEEVRALAGWAHRG